MQQVGMAGLALHGKVFMRQVGVMVGLACCGGAHMQQDLHATLGRCCGKVFMGWVGVKVRLVHCVGMVSEQCCGKSCMP